MFDFNRLKRIFDPMINGSIPSGEMDPTYPNLPSPMQMPSSIETPTAQMTGGYEPKNDAQNRLNQLIGQMPQREPASMIRKLGNLLVSSVNGPEQAAKLFDMPHQQKMSDWGTKLKPAEYAANLERQSNTQELTEMRLTEIERKNRETATLGRDKMNQAPELIDKRTQGAIEVEGAKQPNRVVLENTKQEGRTDLAWSDPYEIAMPDGTKAYYQTNKADGTTRPVNFPGTATKIGTPSKTTGGQTTEQLQGLRDGAQEAISLIDKLIDEKGAIRPESLMAVGGSRLYGLTPNLPAGLHSILGGKKIDQAKTANSYMQALKSRAIIGLIQEMKAQSRTGATGFGALNLKELGVLEKEFAEWDPELPEEAFAKGLTALKSRLAKILQPGEGELKPVTSVKPGSRETPEDIYRRLGGGL